MTTSSVQDFMKQQGFVSVVTSVKENANGYPYVTFLNAKNEAENIYFSKTCSNTVAKGQVIAKGFFTPFMIAQVENAAGEKRTKLVTGQRINVEDLF